MKLEALKIRTHDTERRREGRCPEDNRFLIPEDEFALGLRSFIVAQFNGK
jgi:hypothetical protein